ncbi:hypothetical protein [Oceanicaulis sp. MMSF_3324]|uniref:hypothetical protein n=1 Tax=Oceanicaulis sp. MMSF_3324 TaxID=3046702 RepID=UPI00273D50B3|nr:hypothetical protein [Oceanicaulis sp. MMSF_3324]
MTLSLERRDYADGRVLSIHITGLNKAQDSLSNAPKLCARIRDNEYEGLIMNYQGCRFDHTVSQFAKVAEILSEGMPPSLRIAYVYDQTNLIHAAYITRLMKSAGLNARALGGFESALAFASGEEISSAAPVQAASPVQPKILD